LSLEDLGKAGYTEISKKAVDKLFLLKVYAPSPRHKKPIDRLTARLNPKYWSLPLWSSLLIDSIVFKHDTSQEPAFTRPKLRSETESKLNKLYSSMLPF